MRRVVLLALAFVLLGAVFYTLISLAGAGLPRVESLARTVPKRTSMMRTREAEARRRDRPYRIDQRWVPYAGISPLLRRAVLIAEDDAFFSHGGLDWNEMQRAARTNLERRRVVRGGSTITQQLAKNLYLSEERTLLRKLKEVILAVRIERALPKRRIFELYLNLIEWGDGVYGAEAAARHHFGVSAAHLDARQSALLAAVIINPRRYSPNDPGRRIEKRMRMILSRMRRRGFVSELEYRAALGEAPAPAPGGLDWLFGGPDTLEAPATADSTIGPFPDAASEADSNSLVPEPDTVSGG